MLSMSGTMVNSHNSTNEVDAVLSNSIARVESICSRCKVSRSDELMRRSIPCTVLRLNLLT